MDVPNGQTITNLRVTDYLPNNMFFMSVLSSSPAGAVVTPPLAIPGNSPNNELLVTFPSVTGTSAANDATFTFRYYIPLNDANSAPVIDASSGDDCHF